MCGGDEFKFNYGDSILSCLSNSQEINLYQNVETYRQNFAPQNKTL